VTQQVLILLEALVASVQKQEQQTRLDNYDVRCISMLVYRGSHQRQVLRSHVLCVRPQAEARPQPRQSPDEEGWADVRG